MDEPITRLENLPTSVKGFCYHDDDGEVFVVLNARLTHEANLASYDHELAHIEHDDLDNKDYNEYGKENTA